MTHAGHTFTYTFLDLFSDAHETCANGAKVAVQPWLAFERVGSTTCILYVLSHLTEYAAHKPGDMLYLLTSREHFA